MNRHKPRQSFAQSYVLDRLNGSCAPLPSVAELARQAGVSYVTMWKAVSTLRARGALKHSAEKAPRASTPAAVRPRWHDIRARIMHDIMAGRYGPGSTFGCKQAVSEYGTCYRTARQALECLEGRGWLERDKRRYKVRGFSTGRTSATVVLISTVNRAMSVSVLTPRLQELVRACEIHCSRMHLDLEPIFVPPGASASFVNAVRIPSGPSIAGYLVWLGDMNAVTTGVLLGRLAVTGKAIAVLDEVGEVSRERTGPHPRNTAFFSMANSVNAGRAMGALLLGLGHRSVGFIGYNRPQPWGINRYNGMREVFDEANEREALRLFSIGPGSDPRIPAATIDTALITHGVCALVAETDAIGIACLERLDGIGIRPGADVSVAGFDDTPDAFVHNLTSYNFNCEATTHAMLAHLLGRREPSTRHHRSEAIEIEGFLSVRSSTGPAPRTAVSRKQEKRH